MQQRSLWRRIAMCAVAIAVSATVLIPAQVSGASTAPGGGGSPQFARYPWSPCVFDTSYTPVRYVSASEYASRGYPAVSVTPRIKGDSIVHNYTNANYLYSTLNAQGAPSSCTAWHHLSWNEYLSMGAPSYSQSGLYFYQMGSNIYWRVNNSGYFLIDYPTWCYYGQPVPIVVSRLP